MTGSTSGPTSPGESRFPAADRQSTERAALAVQRPGTHLRTSPATHPKALGRRIHSPTLRQTPRLPQRPLETDPSVPVSARAANAQVETTAVPPLPLDPGARQHTLLYVLSRAGRLTFDAMLLIVFAPVIAVWWFSEKRHRRQSRN